MHRHTGLSAAIGVKAQKINDILKYVVCLLPTANSAFFGQKKLRFRFSVSRVNRVNSVKLGIEVEA